MAISIPYNVLFYVILPRLPINTLGRFKCVSKGLRSFLSSNAFMKIYVRHIDNYHQNHDKFLVLSTDDRSGTVSLSTFDCEAPDPTLTPTSFCLPNAYKIKFLTSFHGLVCLYVIKGPYHIYPNNIPTLILWNPATREYKKLSKPKSDKDRHGIWESSFVLSYSSSEDDYKLVSVISNKNVLIYSLKSDSWRRVKFQVKSDLNIDRLSQGTSLEENLYFLNDDKYYSVVKFNTKTETFTEMKVSPALDIIQGSYRSTLMVKRGCICVCVMYDKIKYGFQITLIELWKINKEGNWKMMVTHQVDSNQMGCGMKPLHYLTSNQMGCCMKPLHLTTNGNLLMCSKRDANAPKYFYCRCNRDQLYNIDLNKNKLNMQKPCKGIGKSKEFLPVTNRRISEIVRYVETFVSPNQYIK